MKILLTILLILFGNWLIAQTIAAKEDIEEYNFFYSDSAQCQPPALPRLPAPAQRLHLPLGHARGAQHRGADPAAPAGSARGQGHGPAAAPVPAAQPHGDGRAV